jgi:hypothetical protein
MKWGHVKAGRKAVALPMPNDAPVTNAILFIVSLLFRYLLLEWLVSQIQSKFF